MQSQTSNAEFEPTELLTQEKGINLYQIQKLPSLKPTYDQVSPSSLKPHQWNSSIYGDTEDVSDLVALICESGWLKPLVVTPTGTIISGHRRWKAALELGLESVQVVVREFPNETASLEALLLENAARIKTTEQKVREANAWKNVEATKAKFRIITTQNNHAGKAAMENFPQLVTAKGTTRDAIAHRVGLGSGRTYSKAAKVVEAIDFETSSGNLETAQALRQVLNKKSVDAAAKLLDSTTKGSLTDRSNLVLGQTPVDSDSNSGSMPALSNTSDHHKTSPFTSCWNCQYRGELIENHSFYCNRLGVLSLIDKSADARGAECDLWSYQLADSFEAMNKTQPSYETFTLTLPAHLQSLIQDAARAKGMSVVDWATVVLESLARATCTDPSLKPKFQSQSK